MNSSSIPFSIEDIEGTVADRFELVASTVPNHLAVKSAACSYTYKTLNEKANQIAKVLIEAGGEVEGSVAILLGYGADVVAAILGVLKAGMVYVVLDSSLPVSRLQYITKDSLAGFLLSDEENLLLAGELSREEYPVIDLDNLKTGLSKENPGVQTLPSSPVAIYYTSGSTGQPKGILRCNRDILYRGWTHKDLYKIESEDRASQVFLFSFAASTSDMFGIILNGATLYLHDIRNSDLQQTVDWLVSEEITIFHPPVAFFRKLLDDLTEEVKNSKLRLVLFGGASLIKKDVELSRKVFPTTCILVNRLSSTEVGLTTNFMIEKDTKIHGDTVPIGYPIKGMEVTLLDDEGNAVGPGEVGEIAVRNRYLSLGYWQDAKLTKKNSHSSSSHGEDPLFVTRDLACRDQDGCLEYLGRKDSAIKVRGYRVDTTEVEAAILSHPAIKQTAVSAHPAPGSEEKWLVAYIVLKNTIAPEKRELREFLELKIPRYMIPARFIFLDTVPINSNGKIDYSALPDPSKNSNEPFVLPRDEIEISIAKFWSQTLNLENIGINENFFELGGDSLTALSLAVKLKKELGSNATLTSLFEVPTIAHQATILRCI